MNHDHHEKRITRWFLAPRPGDFYLALLGEKKFDLPSRGKTGSSEREAKQTEARR